MSVVSFAVSVAIIISIDIHIIDGGECGLQSCGGWITCWKHGIGLAWNILMFLMWRMVKHSGETFTSEMAVLESTMHICKL